MTISDFITKAIEGGWQDDQKAQFLIASIGSTDPDRNGTQLHIQFGDHILLDPLAWQAVGKVEGWGEAGKYNSIPAEWLSNMHRLIDALVEGKTIEQYLETL